MLLKCVQLLALATTALALVPAGAHLFALPNKLDLGQEAYFAVQGIYRGWALFGIVLLAALASNLALAVLTRRRARTFALAAGACLAILAILAIFFVWVFPANQATANWTAVPAGWQALRAQWEYGHAVNAILTFLAFCAVALAVVLDAPPGRRVHGSPAGTA